MTTLTIHLDDLLADRVHKQAAKEGITIEKVVNDALARHVDDTGHSLVEFIKNVRQQGWRSDGTGYLTDDEMYAR